MLPCVCSVIDHRRRQNAVRTSVTHSAIASCATFFVLTTFWRHLWSITEQTHGNMESISSSVQLCDTGISTTATVRQLNYQAIYERNPKGEQNPWSQNYSKLLFFSSACTLLVSAQGTSAISAVKINVLFNIYLCSWIFLSHLEGIWMKRRRFLFPNIISSATLQLWSSDYVSSFHYRR